MTSPPPLSVVVATSQPWPELRMVLGSLAAQVAALGAEVIVAAGHEAALPDDHGLPNVRVVRRTGATVHQLQALAFAEARAGVVALTEDHCRVAPDWCEQVLRAHHAHPRAAAIGGVVRNGADGSLWDWASFLISNGPFLPPVPVGERPLISGHANLSFKRWALPAPAPHGYDDSAHKRALQAAGHTLVTDDRVVTTHVQSLGRLGSCLIHYHNARTVAGFAGLRCTRARRTGHALRRLLLPVRMAADSTRIVARTLVRKPGYGRVAILAWPLITLMLGFHVAGEGSCGDDRLRGLLRQGPHRIPLPRPRRGADACLIDVADDDGRLRRVAAATRDRSRTRLAREFLDRYPPDPAGPHPIATAMRTGESVLQAQMPDAFFDAIAHDAEHRRLTRELALKSSIVVPMIARGRPLGAISLFASDSVPAYGPEDLALAEDLTRRVAFAVENAHLHRESDRRLQEAELVAEVARDINASLNLDIVMQRIVDTARTLCRADLAAIFLRESPGGAAVARYGAGGAPSSRYRTVRIEPGQGLGGQVLLTGEPVRTANYPEDPRFSEEYRKLPESERILALLAVPVRYGDYVRGVLYVANRSPHAFSDRDEAVVQRLSDHAAVAIQNVELFAREQASRSAAEEASHAKDEFVATLSHELRTPLTAILGWVRMLRAGSMDAATAERGLDVIERNARSQAQLIEDLLDVSRIATGKLRLDVRPLRIADVIEAAVDTLRPAAEAKEQRLTAVLDPRAGQVSGDPDRLQQVVTNLLSNAVKFTPKGGRVEVRLARVSSHVEIVVSDSGPGIPPQSLPHIFDRFRQADSSSTRLHAGLGIGLAVVRHLVELHGGTVGARSDEGGGASFTVTLPVLPMYAVTPASEHPTAGGTAAAASAALRGVRVLLVDDEADTLEVFTTVLAARGAEVRTADSASTALEILERWTPDLLVSDIGMPGRDGYAFIRQVRATQAQGAPPLPAIAVTAYGRVEDRIRILDAGFQMHLTKPVDPAELVAAVASLRPRTAL